MLYAVRAPTLKNRGLFAPLSRESGLLLNNALMCSAALTVLLGTLYPLFLDAFGLGKISVGAPFFNQVFLPLMAPVLMLMGVGPLLPWKRADLANVFGRLKLATLLLGVAVTVPWLFRGADGATALLAACGFGSAAWVACGTLTAWWDQVKPRPGAGSSLGNDCGGFPDPYGG